MLWHFFSNFGASHTHILSLRIIFYNILVIFIHLIFILVVKAIKRSVRHCPMTCLLSIAWLI
jgi:hypothetical protein